jgi:ribose 5-phosphate isomerase B
MIYISSDHAGFELKNKIVNHLEFQEIPCKDMGPYELNPTDDYPDFVKPLVDKVLAKSDNKGVLLCRNGVGMCMFANKFKGVRAVLSWNSKHAASSRNDDNTNVLCLPTDYIFEEEALNTVDAWLKTPFGKEVRYARRLKKGNL